MSRPCAFGRIAPGTAEAEILIRGTYITGFGVVTVLLLSAPGPPSSSVTTGFRQGPRPNYRCRTVYCGERWTEGKQSCVRHALGAAHSAATGSPRPKPAAISRPSAGARCLPPRTPAASTERHLLSPERDRTGPDRTGPDRTGPDRGRGPNPIRSSAPPMGAARDRSRGRPSQASRSPPAPLVAGWASAARATDFPVGRSTAVRPYGAVVARAQAPRRGPPPGPRALKGEPVGARPRVAGQDPQNDLTF